MKELKPGIYPQIYRDAIHSNGHHDYLNQLDTKFKLYNELECSGVAMHGFTREMTPPVFKELADLAHKNNLPCLAAYGLDATDSVGKAQRIAAVSVLAECAATLFDMEEAWEVDASDKPKAKQMGAAFRALAPNALVIDQPWPDPTFHWSLFPWEETAAFVDIRAAQWYYNDFKSNYGKDRYQKCTEKFTKSWAKLNERLAPLNLVRPEIKTIQSAGWDDNFSDLVNCLTSNPTLVVWCEPWLSDTFIKGIKVKNELAKRGFTGEQAVKNLQASLGLVADNICGPQTLTALGIPA